MKRIVGCLAALLLSSAASADVIVDNVNGYTLDAQNRTIRFTALLIGDDGKVVLIPEVEQALMAHPDVQDCAVVGLPDEKWGERVVAVVQGRGSVVPDPEALVAFVKSRLGSVKAPKQVEVWEDLPRSKVGKVLKSDIKERLAAG